MTPSAPQEEKAAAEEPSRALSREELIMQDEKARQMYEELMSLRKSLDSLKDVTVSSAGEVAGKAAEKVSERESMPEVKNSSDVAAAEKAVIERAKEDNAQRMKEQAEKLERERRIKEEQQRALEAQKRAERISEEAERKRREAIEAERNAKEVARKKALEVMEAERRAREKAILDQHTATPEEMAAFFGGSSERFKKKGRADEEVLDELKEKLITEQEKQDARVNKISEIAGEKTEELAERRDAKIEEVAAVQQKLKDEQEERLRKQQTRTEFEKIKAKEAVKAGREKDLQRIREREERKKRVRAERLAKVERKRAERAEKDAEKERIRAEKRAKAAELARLKAQRKADAKLGGGIVHVKGMKISTEINRKPSFRWRDFFGIASIKEKRAATEEEREKLREEREERRDQARLAAEILSKQRAERYNNSGFGRRMNRIKAYCDTHKKVLLMGFSACVMAVVCFAGVVNYCTAYAYSYNGQQLGYVKDQNDVLRITDLVSGALTEEKDLEVVIDARDDITFERERIIGKNIELDTSEDVLRRLTYMGDLNIKASAIFVNGEKVGAVPDEKTAEKVIEDLVEGYSGSMEGAEIENIELMDKVEIRDSNTDLQDLMTEEELLEKLRTSGKKETIHKVVAGDTLNSLAKLYSVSEEDILKENKNIDSKKLEVGSSLVIRQNAPIVSVKITERVTYDKVIEHKVEKKDSADIYEGYTETQQKGSDGLSEVTSSIVTVNGEQVDEKNIVTTVKTEPVTEVLLVGTKERPPTVGSGKYAWPLKDSYRVTSKFGSRWGDLHKGVDLACSTGTNIYAADGGTVIKAGYSGTYGNLVVIDHQNGQETRYAHCSKLLVSVGDKVFQGQHIAEVGNTGRSTGPHLHFEIRIGGSPKNPFNYLP